MLQSEDARRGPCATLATADLFPRQLRIRDAKWQFLAHVIGSGERPDFPGGVLRSAFKLFSRKLPPSNVKLCFFNVKSSLIRLTQAFAFRELLPVRLSLGGAAAVTQAPRALS